MLCILVGFCERRVYFVRVFLYLKDKKCLFLEFLGREFEGGAFCKKPLPHNIIIFIQFYKFRNNGALVADALD